MKLRAEKLLSGPSFETVKVGVNFLEEKKLSK